MVNDEQKSPQCQQKVIALQFEDKDSLFAAYMPFIRNGGLFISSQDQHKLGDELFMLLSLPENAEKYPVAGKVAWLTPPCAQGGRPAGFGIQFVGDDTQKVHDIIEKLLAGMMESENDTSTM